MTKKEQPTITLKEAFEEYARKEMEFYQSAKKDKLYSRVIPNLKEKDKGSIDFYYNGIVFGGIIYKQTITLNKLKVTKFGTEEEIPRAIEALEKSLEGSNVVLDNQLK